MKMLLRKHWLIIGLGLLILIIGFSFISSKNSEQNDNTVTLILSPHFDDAVLSLGGLLAQENHERIVATFFTATSSMQEQHVKALNELKNVHTQNFVYTEWQGNSEEELVLQSEISKDIQTLISSIGDKKIKVYGPAYFTEAINDSEHALVHNAYIDVARSYPKDTVEFFVYEDYPYVELFNTTSVISLEKNLENQTGLLVQKIELPLTRGEVTQKIKSLTHYTPNINASQMFTESRCAVTLRSACEVVYKVFKY